MAELKPCPFCGGAAVHAPHMLRVVCKECGASTSNFTGMLGNFQREHRAAAAAWERRAANAGALVPWVPSDNMIAAVEAKAEAGNLDLLKGYREVYTRIWQAMLGASGCEYVPPNSATPENE